MENVFDVIMRFIFGGEQPPEENGENGDDDVTEITERDAYPFSDVAQERMRQAF